MELLELLIIAPILYLVLIAVIKMRNTELDRAYNDAQLQASILLGQGQKVEAMALMDNALMIYKRSYIRKVLGYKV